MIKPNWKDAPEWANYLAQDLDGTWCWYKNEPELWETGGMWEASVDEWEIAKDKRWPGNHKWTETLEPRP